MLLTVNKAECMSAESLTTNLDHQLEQATELRKLAYLVVVAEHRGQFTRAHNLASALFYRSLQTHEAIEILIQRQLTEDARVLARVLVEQAVNCAYMLTVADEQTADDFVKYPKYMRYVLLRDLKRIDENRVRRSVSPELEEEVRLEYESLRPRFKDRRTGEWSADGPLYQRAAKVDDKFSEALKKPYTEFRWLVNSEWRFAGSHVLRCSNAPGAVFAVSFRAASTEQIRTHHEAHEQSSKLGNIDPWCAS